MFCCFKKKRTNVFTGNITNSKEQKRVSERANERRKGENVSDFMSKRFSFSPLRFMLVAGKEKKKTPSRYFSTDLPHPTLIPLFIAWSMTSMENETLLKMNFSISFLVLFPSNKFVYNMYTTRL
jgi:hypothetical protein